MKTALFTGLFLALLAFPVSVFAQPSQSGGGNFFSARWGMSPEQVTAALANDGMIPRGTPSTRAHETSASFDHGNGGQNTVICYFQNNRFYRVVYYVDNSELSGVLENIKTKYGRGKIETFIGDITGDQQRHITEWSDDETVIRHEVSYMREDAGSAFPRPENQPYKTIPRSGREDGGPVFPWQQELPYTNSRPAVSWQSKKIKMESWTGPVVSETPFEEILL